MPHVLIADSEPESAAWMAQVSKAEGYSVFCATTMAAARGHIACQTPDVLIADVQLPDGNGMHLIHDLEAPRQTKIIVVTAHATLASAVDAVRIGAVEYLTKPVDIDRLRAVLRHRPRLIDPVVGNADLRQEQRDSGRFGHMIGRSAPMQSLYDKLLRVAPTNATVLLVGQSGTGKELAARTLHDMSRRRRFPFLAINCGAISPNLIESELFGHEKGSFTGAERQHQGFFEQARGGTVFLDEVTEMPIDMQVKLLRVLETGSFVRVGATEPIHSDVRIVAATNREPEKMVAAGRFRDDLYHRLNVFPITLPPLRERGADVELLAQEFLAHFNRTEHTRKVFSSAALTRLYEMTWPGNVRELKNVVERACILADHVVGFDDAPEAAPLAPGDDSGLVIIRVGMSLDEVERRVTLATLRHCRQVKRAAARVLGISLKTLYNRLDGYAAADRVARVAAGDTDPGRPGSPAGRTAREKPPPVVPKSEDDAGLAATDLPVQT